MTPLISVFTTSGHDVTRQGQILNQLEIIRFYCEQLFDHWIHSQTLPATKHKESQHGKVINIIRNYFGATYIRVYIVLA